MTREQWELRRLYCWSFVVRCGAGLAGWALMTFTDVSFLDDARYYEQVAGGIASDWLAGRPSQWLALHGDNRYMPVVMVTLLACFYVLTLGVRALPLLLAAYCAITALAPGWIYRIGRQFGLAPPVALSAGRLAALCPVFVFWSGALYKEGLILLVLSIAVFHTLRLQAAWHPRSLAIVTICMLLMCGLRIYLAMILAVVVSWALLLGKGRVDTATLIIRQGFVAIAFTIAMVAVASVTHVAEIMPASLADGFALVETSRRDLAAASSGYLRDVQLESPADAVAFLPVGLAHFLAVPLPWQTGSARQNLAIPDTALWVFGLYPLVLVGIVHALRRNFQGTLLLLSLTLALCSFYAIFIGNIGTAYRLRTQVWWLWTIFAAIGWQVWRGRPAFAPRVRGRIRRPVRRPAPAPVTRTLEASGSLPTRTPRESPEPVVSAEGAPAP